MTFMVFTLHCPTCRAALQIRKPELLGQIIACPKCGSMVLVVEPDTAAAERLDDDGEKEEAEYGEKEVGDEDSDVGDGELVAVSTVSTSMWTKFLTDTGYRVSIILSLVGVILLQLLIYTQFPVLDENSPQPDLVVPLSRTTEEEEPSEMTVDTPTDTAVLEVVDMVGDDFPHSPSISDPLPTQTFPSTLFTPSLPSSPSPTSPSPPDIPPDLPPNLPPDLPPPSPAKIIPRTSQFVEDQLKIPLLEMGFENTSLTAAVAVLSQVMNVPITFQSDVLRIRPFTFDGKSAAMSTDTDMVAIHTENSGTKTAIVNFTSGSTTTGELLQTLLEPYDLVFVTDTGQIRITAPELEQPVIREVQYDVTDLLAANWTKEQLSEMLMRLVSPQSWQENGGEATLAGSGNILVVKQTVLEHDTIDRLLEQLRILRDIPQKTARSEAALVPEVFGWDTVLKPLTLQYLSPTPLSKCFTDITRKTDVRILVNHKTLAEEGLRIDNVRSTIVADTWSLDRILSELLGNVDLTYLILGERTVEVTTWSDATAPNRMTIELHPLPAAPIVPSTPNSPVEESDTTEKSKNTPPIPLPIPDRVLAMKQGVSPQTWREVTRPETIGAGDVVFDSVSGYIVVRQSPPIQRAIRKWTNQNRAQN